jgi:hypothetical protein
MVVKAIRQGRKRGKGKVKMPRKNKKRRGGEK